MSISISLSYAHWWTISKKYRYACISLKSTCVTVSFDMVGKCYSMVTVYKYGCEAWQTMELYQLANLKVHQTHFYTIKWVSLELYLEGDSKSKRIKKILTLWRVIQETMK